MNVYRDEVSRHGAVDFPTYTPRSVHDVAFENGTWDGQTGRLAGVSKY